MNNNNIVPQPAEKQGYQTLGTKVFWLFFLQLSPAAFILIIISIIIFALSFQPFLINNLPDYIQQSSLSAALIISIISLFFLALSFAV
ncbi:MAG: hypothetical protein NT094_00915, partial [Candidatus Staskawiczbacteria bacterium]|nr:hypothetical protein [Candidatus Staskawiczbacteria bacterium]